MDVPAHDLVVPREMVACDAHTAPCHPPSPVPILPGHLKAPPLFSVPHLGGHTLPNEVHRPPTAKRGRICSGRLLVAFGERGGQG